MPGKKNEKQFLHEDSDFEFSLSKFLGKKVVDVVGYPSAYFGKDTPVFNITRIIFEDGTSAFIEGEHDIAYLPADNKLKNMDEKTLRRYI